LRYAATFNAGTLTNTPHQFIKWNLIEQGWFDTLQTVFAEWVRRLELCCEIGGEYVE
jgi:hypothetical protein